MASNVSFKAASSATLNASTKEILSSAALLVDTSSAETEDKRIEAETYATTKEKAAFRIVTTPKEVGNI